MQTIKCTAKLRKEMGLEDSALFDGDVTGSVLGPWHANLIYIDRRKCVLFANDKTFFNFLAPNARRDQIRELQKLFLSWLRPTLFFEGFSEAECEKIAAEYAEIGYAKTDNASVLGTMNDLAFQYTYLIKRAGGIHSAEVPAIISMLNYMPMGALKYRFAMGELRRLLAAAP